MELHNTPALETERLILRKFCRNDVPVGYVHLSTDEAHDLGYGLSKGFWHRGIAIEAAQTVVEKAKRDVVPYITGTHDVKNPLGGVMKALGIARNFSIHFFPLT